MFQMKYAELKREFNVLVEVEGDTFANAENEERYKQLVAEHSYLYEHNEYYIGVKISHLIKERVVEPMYVVQPVVKIDGSFFAVTVPSEEVDRISLELFTRWKKGDESYESIFSKPNIYRS
jgi:hypothetical protein